MSNEPEPLKRGKDFHKLIQQEWIEGAEGAILPEHYVKRVNGRKGRIDVFVSDDDPEGVVAIVEIKATDWDKMNEKAVRRNIRRQINQIWKYINSQIYKGDFVPSGEGKSVCPGIIFPNRPRNIKRMEFIEKLFEDEGIPVVWHDETKEERKNRS